MKKWNHKIGLLQLRKSKYYLQQLSTPVKFSPNLFPSENKLFVHFISIFTGEVLCPAHTLATKTAQFLILFCPFFNTCRTGKLLSNFIMPVSLCCKILLHFVLSNNFFSILGCTFLSHTL